MRRAWLLYGLLAFAVMRVLMVAQSPPSYPRRLLAAAPDAVAHLPRARRASQWHWAWKAAVLLVVLAVGGFLVAASGLIPIKASSGHWPITAWLLHFSMQRSVATHTLGLQAPALDDPDLVLRGAGHYETGCRPCHGSPDFQKPRIVQYMTPHPPYLPPVIPTWDSEELFYIVKHGVKFTGMPAWPTQQRNDEVWDMVAFLRLLPALDATEYRRLVDGETTTTTDGLLPIQDLAPASAVSQALITSCARCHGVDGEGRGTGAFPRLAGQRPAYLYAALQAYAHGTRHSGVMGPIAAGLSRDSMRELALHYGKMPAPPASPLSQETLLAIERGREIATRGIPPRRVPACAACHGPGTTPRNPVYPGLAGQHADYLVLQLELFKHERRGGSAYAHLMRPVASRLTPEQIRDVALYYASLPAPSELPMP